MLSGIFFVIEEMKSWLSSSRNGNIFSCMECLEKRDYTIIFLVNGMYLLSLMPVDFSIQGLYKVHPFTTSSQKKSMSIFICS